MSRTFFCLTDWQLLSKGSEIKMSPKVMGQDPKMEINNGLTFVRDQTWAFVSDQTWEKSKTSTS